MLSRDFDEQFVRQILRRERAFQPPQEKPKQILFVLEKDFWQVAR